MRYIIIMCACLVMLGCNNNVVVQNEWEGGERPQWNETDVVTIQHNVVDTTARFDLVVDLTHTTQFKYQNLYVEVGNITPAGDTLTTPVSLELANPKGQWQGNCSGDNCSASIVLKDHFYFPQMGEYRIWVKPYMRMNPVEGVVAVAFSLQHSEGAI